MKKLLVLLLALVVLGTGAWVVADRVESPDQAAARAEPPAPVPVVAALTRGFLNGPVSVSAGAVQEQVVTITPPAAVNGVVTAAEGAPGQTLSSGSVVLRVNGRPLFVLAGAFALFRDIQPGDSGDDVAAVQSGLKAAGLSIGRDKPGVYGSGTQSAVRSMYRTAGYTAPQAVPAVVEEPADVATGSAADGKAAAPVPVAPVSAGTVVLRSEVMTVVGIPAAIQSVAPVGTALVADTNLMTLGAGLVVLSATVPSASLGALTVGAVASFSDDTGAGVTATVTAINPSADGVQSTVVLTPDGGVTVGKPYLLTITNPAAESGERLLAPMAGIVSRGGRSYVNVRDGAVFTEVEVAVEGSVGGVVAITPVGTDVSLDAGVEIRVG